MTRRENPPEHTTRLPRPARMLLRLSRVPREHREEIEADLLELWASRHVERGTRHARWRLYHDLASVWWRAGATASANSGSSRANRRDWRVAVLRDAGADLRHGVRVFRRQPAVLLLTILGLSLGLGIATAGFSIMNAAVLRGEGIVDSERLPGVLRVEGHSRATGWKYDEFLHLRSGATSMRVEAAMRDVAAVRLSAGRASVTTVPSAALAFVSGGFFAATGGRMTAGRPLEPGDEDHVGPPPVVVSFIFWKSRLDGDPNAVGRTIRVGRTDATIVGIAERGFTAPTNRVLWLPLTAYGAVYDDAPGSRTPGLGVEVFGRLLPGVSSSAAQAQLDAVAAALPGGTPDRTVRVQLATDAGLGRMASADTATVTVSVLAAIGLVLLLACANVATVLIATAITREREIGVRAALGASRRRIVRQLVNESLALGGVAAVIALLVTTWAIPFIGRMIEAPAGADLAPDLTVYSFLAIVTVLTGIGAGLAPAWHGRGADLVTPLKGDGARQNRLAPRRLRSALISLQAAVSLLLIVVAALFVRATFRASAVDVGFEPAGLFAISPGLGRSAFENDGAGVRGVWARAIPELQRVPGVASVTLTEVPPFGDLTRTSIPRDRPGRVVHLHRTRAEYFETLGISLVAGRSYTSTEVAAGAPVAVVSESLARAYWPAGSPVGQVLPPEIPFPATRPVVIGVVRDVITADLHDPDPFALYTPMDPAAEVFGHLLIRIASDTPGAAHAVAERLRAIEPLANPRTSSVHADLQQHAGRPRRLATFTGFVGLIAVILCAIGLFGLTASVVGQRTRELGVRTAMGAEPRDLLRLMMWDSLRPVAAGLAIGAALAALASRFIASAIFFGVSPQDPVAFLAAAAVLLAAAILAVVVPTRRAAAVDAASVLRGA